MSSIGPNPRLSFFLGSKGFPRGRSHVMYVVEHRDGAGDWSEEARFGAPSQAEHAIDEFVAEGHGALGDFRVVERNNPKGRRGSTRS